MPVLPHRHSIVVGVDGSAPSELALDWAAAEAHGQGAPLHLLHATNLDWLVAATLVDDPSRWPVADAVLDAASRRVRASYAELRMTAQTTTGAPADDLVAASREAREVVVGAHGRTRGPLPLGSVATAVATHATSPVVVARPYATATQARRPVVVGIDGSARGAAAIDFAMSHASRHGLPVVALHAWWLEFIDGVVVTTPGSPEWRIARERMELRVAEALAGYCERYPDVQVTRRFVEARPAIALGQASREASLVVVGARGRGGFASLLLGSVSREVLMHASSPVAVVRA